MTSSEWDDKYHKLINHLNANPHIAATYPFMETVPRDMRDIILDLSASEARRAALVEYCRHFPWCPLAQWSQGRPTKDGGYETMYAGKWYRGDDKPACTCGLDATLAPGGEPESVDGPTAERADEILGKEHYVLAPEEDPK